MKNVRPLSGAALVALGMALTACGNGSGSISIIGVDPLGELSVEVSGLPSGSAADVTVARDGYRVGLTASKKLSDLPLGTYDVTAATVMADGAPYLAVVTPPRVTFTDAAQRATVKVQYDLPPTGQLTLNVAGVPAGQATTLRLTGPNGFKRDVSGVATQTLTDLAPGDYNVTADSVRSENFTYPAIIQGATVTVRRGRTSVTNVSFARDPRFGHLGLRLLGLPEGAVGAVDVRDAGGAQRTQTGSGVLTDLAVGAVAVTPRNVPFMGMTYRAPGVTANVPSAGVLSLDVPYAPITGRLRVVVNSPVAVPAGSITVAGQKMNDTTTLDDVMPGAYELSAATFTDKGYTYVPTVDASPVSVSAGNMAGVMVTYVAQIDRPDVTLDLAPPKVTLDAVGETFGNTLSGTASDERSGVTVEVYDGSVPLGTVSPDAQGRWELAWTTATPGEHDLTVIAVDAAGNSTRLTQTVTVNLNQPE
jgi:hypothetical protein